MRKKLTALCLALTLTLACACACACANATPLPVDLSPAPAADEAGYLSEREYRDETLHVLIEDYERDDSVYHVAFVELADASQQRTALSDAPGGKGKAAPSLIAQANNAVVAINGDYYLYRSRGYVMRQGEVLRKAGQGELDLLLIDDAGDLHVVRKPAKSAVREALAGHAVVNAFSFGPVLVMDGEVQTVYNGYGFAPQDRSPRTAIGQLGPLRYALVVVDGRQKQSRGVTHKQLATFMGELGCTTAYNLDGGDTSTLIFHGQVFNSLSGDGERPISDIIYAGTAR